MTWISQTRISAVMSITGIRKILSSGRPTCCARRHARIIQKAIYAGTDQQPQAPVGVQKANSKSTYFLLFYSWTLEVRTYFCCFTSWTLEVRTYFSECFFVVLHAAHLKSEHIFCCFTCWTLKVRTYFLLFYMWISPHGPGPSHLDLDLPTWTWTWLFFIYWWQFYTRQVRIRPRCACLGYIDTHI